MAWGSTVPNAMDALIVALRGAPDLAGLKIFDGPDTDASSQVEALLVGLGGEDDPTAVEGQLAREGLSAHRDSEQYGIRCLLIVLNGSGDVGAARRRAFDLLGAVGGALAADQRLGGTVMTASLGTYGYSQEQTDQGAHATLAFTVDIDAFTRR